MPSAEPARPYGDVDLWPTAEIADAIVATQQVALSAVAGATAALANAADALAACLRDGGRMAYAGAGSSGLLAQVDALELPGTYGLPPDRVPVILAGGDDGLRAIQSACEDDMAAAEAAVDALGLTGRDALIAVAASGTTRFTLAALQRAAARGAVTVAVACRPGTPLLAAAQHPILLATPDEVIGGSTRMAAGTAQKCALNVLSTAVAVRLGHGFRGLMVNMTADNDKLRDRATGIVAEATGMTPEQAGQALAAADGSIKIAIAASLGGWTPAEARVQLARHDGDLRAVLRNEAAA